MERKEGRKIKGDPGEVGVEREVVQKEERAKEVLKLYYIIILGCYLLGIPRQPTCMKLGTGGFLSAYTILHVQVGFIHVICLGMSNKYVGVPRQDSMSPVRAYNPFILYHYTEKQVV